MDTAERGQNLSVYYHTHWDREWYLPFRAYQVRLGEVVDEVLIRLEKNELPCFTLDGQTVLLDDYLEIRPENRERLAKLIREGRISIGPWYVMPDEFLVSGESLIRNLMRGIRQSREWGCNSFTGYLPDTFGHSADMPTILRGFGIDTAILWRGLNPKKSLINWQSPSGASVRTLHLTDGYFQMMLDDWTATPEEQIAALDKLVEKLEAASPKDGLGLLPMGADHMGPLPAEGRKRLLERYPSLKETTPDLFMNSLNGVGELEMVTGELMDNSAAFLLPGVWSSRMYLKQFNRKLEHHLVHRLEPLLAMSQALLPEEQRPRYPKHELDLAWTTLMLNHPHDSICGCSVDEVHRENEVRFEQVQELIDAMEVRTEHALRQIAAEDEWIIFNTGDQPYTGVVSVAEDLQEEREPSFIAQVVEEYTPLQDQYLYDSHRIPLSHLTKYFKRGAIWVDKVPAKGFKTIPKSSTFSYEPVLVTERCLENEYLSIQVELDGTLAITDKKTTQVYSKLFSLERSWNMGDSYNSAPSLEVEPVTSSLEKVNIWSEGPLGGVLELQYLLGRDFISVYLLLKVDSPMLKFSLDYTAPEMYTKVRAIFQTSSPTQTVQAESHLGIIERQYDSNYRELDQMPAETMKELKTNTGPIQRFLSVNGQTFITEGLAEYEVYKQTISLTLLRTFDSLSQRKLSTRGAPAGPPMNVAEGNYPVRRWIGKDPSRFFRFAWMPTPDDPAKLYEAAGRFYGNVWGFSGKGAKNIVDAQSLIHWDRPELVTSACYWLPEKGLVLRVINTSDKSVTATFKPGFASKGLWAVNFLEEPQEKLDAFNATVGPRDVQTLLFAV